MLYQTTASIKTVASVQKDRGSVLYQANASINKHDKRNLVPAAWWLWGGDGSRQHTGRRRREGEARGGRRGTARRQSISKSTSRLDVDHASLDAASPLSLTPARPPPSRPARRAPYAPASRGPSAHGTRVCAVRWACATRVAYLWLRRLLVASGALGVVGRCRSRLR